MMRALNENKKVYLINVKINKKYQRLLKNFHQLYVSQKLPFSVRSQYSFILFCYRYNIL